MEVSMAVNDSGNYPPVTALSLCASVWLGLIPTAHATCGGSFPRTVSSCTVLFFYSGMQHPSSEEHKIREMIRTRRHNYMTSPPPPTYLPIHLPLPTSKPVHIRTHIMRTRCQPQVIYIMHPAFSQASPATLSSQHSPFPPPPGTTPIILYLAP